MAGIWKKIQNRYMNTSSFLKITILFETVLVISLVFVSLYATDSFSDILKKKEIALGESRIEKLSGFMQEEYNRVYSLGNYIHSGDIFKIMSQIQKTESMAYDYDNIAAIQVFFSAISYADMNISDVILVSNRGNVYSYTRQASYEVNPSYSFLDDDIVEAFLESEDSLRILYEDPSRYCIRKRESVISFIGKIYDASLYPRKEIVGLYIMNIPLSQIDQSLDFNDQTGQGQLYLLNQDNRIIYTTDSKMAGLLYNDKEMTMGKDTYVSTRSLGSSGLKIQFILSEAILFSQIHYIRSQIYLILILSIAVTLLFSCIIYKVFYRKMSMLLNSMEEVQHGNFQTRLLVDSQDEIGKISDSFNEMCEKLNIYVEQVYKSEIQRKNAEINALQTQIDPHFLYNTLESIKAKALSNDDEDAAEMISILGNMFRWSSRTGKKTASLDEELEYIRNYLVLQSYRYNQQLEIHIDVDENYLDYVVPKLILQPIVENVIKHALDAVDRKKLVGISAKKKDDNLELTVYDNGQGIPKGKLQAICEELQTATKQDEFESIGIYNVNQRLKLMFGPEYGLQIKSIEDYGTAVKIIVPILTDKEMDQYV